jgi:hypothetical protein
MASIVAITGEDERAWKDGLIWLKSNKRTVFVGQLMTDQILKLQNADDAKGGTGDLIS